LVLFSSFPSVKHGFACFLLRVNGTALVPTLHPYRFDFFLMNGALFPVPRNLELEYPPPTNPGIFFLCARETKVVFSSEPFTVPISRAPCGSGDFSPGFFFGRHFFLLIHIFLQFFAGVAILSVPAIFPFRRTCFPPPPPFPHLSFSTADNSFGFSLSPDSLPGLRILFTNEFPARPLPFGCSTFTSPLPGGPPFPASWFIFPPRSSRFFWFSQWPAFFFATFFRSINAVFCRSGRNFFPARL